jgi:lysozyme
MIRGIDISDQNDAINIAGLPADIAFVWMKATEGITFKDPTFQGYYQAVKDDLPNVKRGAYHFFIWQDDPTAQAQNFLSRGVDFTLPGVLPPMLDLENNSDQVDAWMLQNTAQCVQSVTTFLNYVKQQTGKDCIIYTYKNFLIEQLGSASWPNNGLWLAAYQTELPGLPPGYDESDLWFWQYSQYGQLDGTTTGGSLDLDQYMGTQDQLDALTNSQQTA